MIRRACALVVAFLSLPALATAQPVSSLADLPLKVDLGDKVIVTDNTGRDWSGRVTGMTPTEIAVSIDGQDRRFASADVREVALRGDSLRNGTLIGFGAGAALGALFAGGFADNSTAGDYLVGAVMFGGIGAGLGVALDAMISGRRVVYRAGPSVSIAPAVLPGRAYGVAVGLRW